MFVWLLWARSLARIKASASGAENPGFKSQRARHTCQNKFLIYFKMSWGWLKAVLSAFPGFLI